MTTAEPYYVSEFERRYTEVGEARGEARAEARGGARGEAKGEAKLVLKLLAERGITVTDAVRVHISDCLDTEQLEVWFLRALKADKIADLGEDIAAIP
jgi:hypothetical protein